MFETDVLIIGCGIAGGTAALQLADAGLAVTVITKAAQPHESNTFYAQGGIIYEGDHDSADLLVEDVIRAGAGHNRLASAAILAEQGPELVRKILLERIGVGFDRTDDGSLSLTLEGGHTLPRIIHTADATGRAISSALIRAISRHPNITLLSGYTAVDFVTAVVQPVPVAARAARSNQDRGNTDHLLAETSVDVSRCTGVALLDQATNEMVHCSARYTILATGGLGSLYQQTSNPPGARGDGVAMAHRAGAAITDMEYVQFHPTTFYHPEARSFLISEAVRGAGARLVHADGMPFMQNYDSTWLDLAPRDVVARAIWAEMEQHNVSHVYLDLASYIPEAEIRSHFPSIHAFCKKYDVDITRDLVPVVPAAHYACGGVWVDAWGQTSIDGLYAVGEVSCTGLHGANRLASTSLLEGLVWGSRAAQHIGQAMPYALLPQPQRDHSASARAALPAANSAQIDDYRQQIQRLMWTHVGLVRTTAGLTEAQYQLCYLQEKIETLVEESEPSDALLGLRNMAQTALLVTEAALQNETSLGCHYRI